MRKIRYNDASQTLRLEFPTSWDISSITGVDVKITDTDATDLLASTGATLYSATTLDSAAVSGASQIVLDSGAGALASGDVIRLANPPEDCRVRSFDNSTKIATLSAPLLYDHASGSSVSPCWATYSLDASDTDTFVLGGECVITWEADTGDKAHNLAVISKHSHDTQGLVERFRVRYPSEYQVIERDAERYLDEQSDACAVRLRMLGLDIDRVMDTDISDDLVLRWARYSVAAAGGDQWESETDRAWEDYLRAETAAINSPIWVDKDQGEDMDEDETDAQVRLNIARFF